MNCTHCGTSLSPLDPAGDGRFCSNEHRTAYLLNNLEVIRDWMELPVLAAGESAVARFEAGLHSVDFPLQVEIPIREFDKLKSEPAGPLALPYPLNVKPVWKAQSSATPFLPSAVRPQSVILESAWLTTTQPVFGILGVWRSWSPLRKLALLVVPILVATGTHLIVGRTGPAVEEPQAKVLVEDFKSGLEQWQETTSRAKPWKWESSIGASPQSLAVFKPSVGIADYRLEFTADAIKNNLSWATHVRDVQNYHVCQLSLRKSGSDSRFLFLRYMVENGREGARTEVPLQIRPPAGSLWRIKMESVGDSRSLWINGEIANSWNEDNEGSGGIGFFAGKGAQFLLKAVTVYEQLPYTASVKLR